MKKILAAAIILFLSISAAIYNYNQLILILSLILNLFLIYLVLSDKLSKKLFSNLSILAVVGFFLAATAVSASPILQKLENFRSGYNFDGFIFLNTAELIREGQSFWAAYETSFEEDIRFDKGPTDFWGFRQPTIFYLWSLLPSGFYVWIAFLILSSATLYAVFEINKVQSGNLAILTAILLAPYLLYTATTEWFLEIEWWAQFAFIFAIFTWQKKKLQLSWFLFLLAVLTRELFSIPIIVLFLINLFLNKKRTIFFGSIVAIFVLFLLVHFLILKNLAGVTLTGISIHRFLGGGWPFIRQMLAFGSADYLLVNFRVFSLYLLLVVVLSIPVILREKFKILEDLVFVSFWAFLAIFFIFGSLKWHEYWGITFVPLMFLLIPRLLKSSQLFK